MRQLKISKNFTSRGGEALDRYLTEIAREPLLTPDEEVQLAQTIHKGGKEGDQARDLLVRGNLRFVVSVAKQYQHQGITLTDLINEGNVGLVKAAEKFDETRGFKFISYAVWWIRQSILQALAEQARVVRLPLNKVGLTNRIQKAFSQLEQEFEREPSPEELADMLDMDLDEVTSSLGINARHVSMDAPLSEGEESTLLDVLENPNAEKTDEELDHKAGLNIEIERSLKQLTDRQKEVVCYFFGIGVDHPLSLEDIGDRFNLTRERVRQIKDKAITKLRATQKADLLRSYLG